MKAMPNGFVPSLLCFSIFLTHAGSATSDDLLLLDDEEAFPFEELYTEDLYAYQPFPIDSISAQLLKGSDTSLNPQLLMEAASSVEEVKNALEDSGLTVESATPSQILGAFSALSQHSGLMKAMNVYPDINDLFITGQARLLEPRQYDPFFVAMAFDSELIDQDFKNSYYAAIPTSELNQGIKVNREVAIDLLETYELIGSLGDLQPQLVSSNFAFADANISRWLIFSDLAKYALSKVTIGKPIVLTRAESQIEIPGSLQDDYDFYVIIFAFTVKENLDYIKDLTFAISLPDDCLAFDLMPLRHGEEIAVVEELGVPSATVAVPGVSVTFSSIFRKQFGYRILKPTVVAYGLQEESFGWSFREEAVTLGSQRMAAIVGVPKAFGAVPATTSVFVETRNTLFVTGDIASSKPRSHLLLTK